MKLFSLPKREKLTHDGLINRLFKEGVPVSSNPIRIIYKTVEKSTEPRVRIMVTVPRKRFKKAVIRNRIKRLMREAYRHNKPLLPDTSTYALHVAFIYVGDKEDVLYEEIEKALITGLKKMLQALGL